MFDTVQNELGEEKYKNFEEAKSLMSKLVSDVDKIQLIEHLRLKRAILAEADIDEKVGSTSKMIVKLKNEDGSVKGKYAVYFIKIRLR